MANPYGRPRKPDEIKKREGTYRADRAVQSSAPTLDLPRSVPAPGWLSPLASAYWRKLVKLLREMGVLGRQDLDLLATLADQLATYETASRALAGRDGLSFVVTDADGNPKGVSPWPEIKTRQQALVEIRRLCEQFGMSPSSRSRVTSTTDPEENDPFAEFDRPLELVPFRRPAGPAADSVVDE